MARSYYAIGSTLAGMVNLHTYFTYPPKSVRNNQPVPLAGGVRRRALSGKLRASGWINSVLWFDYVPQSEYEAFIYAVFGGFTTASVQRYFTLFDESGHYSSFYGYIERPSVAWETDKALTTVAFPLSKLILQSVTKTANYTVTTADHLVYADTTGGNITLTLPALAGVTQNVVYSFQKTAAANTLTLDADGSETIDGAATLALTAQHARVDLVSNGSQWLTI